MVIGGLGAVAPFCKNRNKESIRCRVSSVIFYKNNGAIFFAKNKGEKWKLIYQNTLLIKN